eukprot:360194-Chlamydomonas_euryale.AAC.20
MEAGVRHGARSHGAVARARRQAAAHRGGRAAAEQLLLIAGLCGHHPAAVHRCMSVAHHGHPDLDLHRCRRIPPTLAPCACTVHDLHSHRLIYARRSLPPQSPQTLNPKP